MEQESSSFPEPRSNKWIWLIAAIIGLCVVFGICMFVGLSGIFFLRQFGGIDTGEPESQSIPSVQTVPVLPSEPTEPVYIDKLPVLDYKADPLYGSINLQRGFSPDPQVVPLLAGGSVDTSDFDLECGFTTEAPVFSFNLSGGASAGFLRIFFVGNGGGDTTLILHTPDNGWLCADDSTYGNGNSPVIDLELADSGEYDVWVGSWQSNIQETGNLFLTQLEETTP